MKTINRERGQSLIIIAIAFLGLAALAALIIDGGSLYLNRRTAQTAADAAALAGAREKCINKGDLTAVQTVAAQFATENHATAVESVTIDADGAIVVQTRVQTSSFFARILGYEDNTVRATATAACFAPSTAKNLLPIAWTCSPPVGGSTEDHCDVHSVPWDIFKTLLTVFNFGPGTDASLLLTEGDSVDYQTYMDTDGEKMAYLVMDDSDFDQLTNCEELSVSGQINCDFNDDGIFEVVGGADRGWLSLDGTGVSDLTDIMINGFPNPITLPQWFPAQNGVANSVFINAHEIINKIVLVPVFNAVCEDTTQTGLPEKCSTEFMPGDLIRTSIGLSTYSRIATFAPFVVTCVSKGNSEKCPAKTFANISKPNVSSIEGYFVNGYSAGTNIDPDGFDMGVYIISLTK